MNHEIFDARSAIKAQFDPDYILMYMALWREAASVEMPLSEKHNPHFLMTHQRILRGHERSAIAWDMLLEAMTAESGQQAYLAEIRLTVREFRAWARARLCDLDEIAAQQRQDCLDQAPLLSPDPAVLIMLRKIQARR